MLSGLSNHNRGVFAMIGSAIFIAAMSALVRYAEHIDVYKLALFRFAIGAMLVGTAAMFNKIELKFVRRDLLFWRGLMGGLSVFFFYLSIRHLGIGKGTVLSNSYAVFAVIIGFFTLKDRVTRGQWLAIAAALVGIYLIASDDIDAEAFGIGFYDWLALLGAVTAGIAIVLVRKLRQTDSPYAIYFSQCVFGFWLMVIPANLTSSDIGWQGGLILISVGVLATVAQLLMTYAFAHVTIASGGLLGNLTPVFNTILAIVLFQETLSGPGLLGIAIVIGSCALVAKSKPQPAIRTM